MTAIVTDIDLDLFCAPAQHPSAAAIGRPWSRGKWTYATNGHVLVRLPRLPDVDDNPLAPDGEALIRACDFGERVAATCWDEPLPPLAHMLLDHDDEQVLVLCQGSLDVGGVPFQLRYLHLIASLPRLELGRQKEPTGPLPFVAACGDILGAVMPLLRPRERHFVRPQLVPWRVAPAKRPPLRVIEGGGDEHGL